MKFNMDKSIKPGYSSSHLLRVIHYLKGLYLKAFLQWKNPNNSVFGTFYFKFFGRFFLLYCRIAEKLYRPQSNKMLVNKIEGYVAKLIITIAITKMNTKWVLTINNERTFADPWKIEHEPRLVIVIITFSFPDKDNYH